LTFSDLACNLIGSPSIMPTPDMHLLLINTFILRTAPHEHLQNPTQGHCVNGSRILCSIHHIFLLASCGLPSRDPVSVTHAPLGLTAENKVLALPATYWRRLDNSPSTHRSCRATLGCTSCQHSIISWMDFGSEVPDRESFPLHGPGLLFHRQLSTREDNSCAQPLMYELSRSDFIRIASCFPGQKCLTVIPSLLPEALHSTRQTSH
jgi:hypothetical protein